VVEHFAPGRDHSAAGETEDDVANVNRDAGDVGRMLALFNCSSFDAG